MRYFDSEKTYYYYKNTCLVPKEGGCTHCSFFDLSTFFTPQRFSTCSKPQELNKCSYQYYNKFRKFFCYTKI